MPNPTASDVHISAPLTNISIAFMQNANNFIADKVFPVVPVTKDTDKYYVWDRGDFNRDEMQLRAPNTESAGGGFRLSSDTYYCNHFALHKDISGRERQNADTPVNLELAATQYLTQQLLIKKEKDFVSNYMTTSVWGTDYTGVASTPSAGQFDQWDDYSNSDPIADIGAARLAIAGATGFMPNTLVLGAQVLEKLENHPDLVDRIKYGQKKNSDVAIVDNSALAAVLKVERVLVSYAIQNTAAEGAAESSSFITGKSALLLYTPSTPSLMQAASGYTFAWQGPNLNPNGSIKKLRFEERECDRIEINAYYDMKKVSASLGAFFATAVA
jgi:hypothetical protein